MASVLMLTFSGIWAAPLPDLVTSIPGLDGAMTSRVFSGYIDAISSTTKQRFKTHYIFTESQSDPTKGLCVSSTKAFSTNAVLDILTQHNACRSSGHVATGGSYLCRCT